MHMPKRTSLKSRGENAECKWGAGEEGGDSIWQSKTLEGILVVKSLDVTLWAPCNVMPPIEIMDYVKYREGKDFILFMSHESQNQGNNLFT